MSDLTPFYGTKLSDLWSGMFITNPDLLHSGSRSQKIIGSWIQIRWTESYGTPYPHTHTIHLCVKIRSAWWKRGCGSKSEFLASLDLTMGRNASYLGVRERRITAVFFQIPGTEEELCTYTYTKGDNNWELEDKRRILKVRKPWDRGEEGRCKQRRNRKAQR